MLHPDRPERPERPDHSERPEPIRREVGHADPTAIHFTCSCGRSVVAPAGSSKVERRQCGRCGSRDNYEDLVRRSA